MLHSLRSSDARFKGVTFKPGMNLLVADVTDTSSDTDTRNGSGKSSLIELLHFLLGARSSKDALTTMPSLRDHTFSLEMTWPGLANTLHVARSASKPNEIRLDPNIALSNTLSPLPGVVSLSEWQTLIERDLFGLPDDHQGISGRAMLSLLMRRVSSHAFNEPVRTFPQQSNAEASANIAYLLGLDWHLVSRYRDIASREATRKKLNQAAKDPVWGKIVGRSSELRGQLTVQSQRVQRLEEQISEFKVVDEYEQLQHRADQIALRIRALRTNDVVDRRTLEDLEEAAQDSLAPEPDYLERVYEDLGVILGDSIKRRYADVRDFHDSITRNRRTYLEEELNSTRSRLQASRLERERLDEEQATLLRTLSEGGALESLMVLQSSLAEARGRLEALRNRFEAAQTLEASRAEIAAERNQLEAELRLDLAEREDMVNDISLLFLDYAQRLYGEGRSAYLEFSPTSAGLKISPTIESSDSVGIGNMVIFCLDLTVAVVAHRSGRGPDFLVHDSHLFDGVDERQIARALSLARDVCESDGMQYLAMLNSDDLQKAENRGFTPDNTVIEPRLTDAHDDGGLFGFRFSR